MDRISELEETIKYSFKSKELLFAALTHASYSSDLEKRIVNEKLEFLGDAVLNAVITFMLYEKFKERDEGFLSNARSYLVRRETLTEIGKDLNLERFIRCEETISPSDSKVISNIVEALIGAIYLDGGIRKVRSVIRRLFSPYFDEERLKQKNPKNLLQEYSQKQYGVLPRYRCVKRKKGGFSVTCKIGNELRAKGFGRTKKEAEMNAAQNVLKLVLGN
ncbi:MAG: ribonuclease III [Desulfobacterota bacterium]|nr:ribonuclease III [Thermodesulfobacteriota bacterium]MDW8002240.1 ribonuclease III [Deltaproteobacteria bacterium]